MRLETRPPNVEGKGAIRQRQLVVNALRMRPDRIVVGEVRGEEALDMLQAMNTGHDGSLTTVHANTPRDALTRIETMIAMGATNLPERAMRQQIASAIQLVVQQTRLSDGSRKVTSISEITGMEGDVITMQEIFLFEKMGITQDGKVIGRFRATGVRPKCCERLQGVGHPPAGRHVRRRHGGAVMLLPLHRLRGRRGLDRRRLLRRHDAAGRCSRPRRLERRLRDVVGRSRRADPKRADDDRRQARASKGRCRASIALVAGTGAGISAGAPDRAVGRADDAERDRADQHRRAPRSSALIAFMFVPQRVRAAGGRVVGAFAAVRLAAASSASARLKKFEEQFPGGARPAVARDPRRPRVPDRARHGGRRTAGAGRPRVQEDVRPAELRPAAARRAERAGGAHRRCSTCASSSPRC